MSTQQQTPEHPAEVVDTRGAAAIVGLAAATLSTLRSRGGGPPFAKIGAAVRYRVADLRAWVAARMRATTSDPLAHEREQGAA